jgi:hypothetical protein
MKHPARRSKRRSATRNRRWRIALQDHNANPKGERAVEPKAAAKSKAAKRLMTL